MAPATGRLRGRASPSRAPPQHRKGYLHYVQRLAHDHPRGPDIDPADLVGWADLLGPSRLNGWKVLRSFYAWATRVGLVERSPLPTTAPRRRMPRDTYTLPEAWQGPLRSYVEHLQASGRAIRTIEVHLAYLRRFAQAHPDPAEVSAEDVVHWFASHTTWKPETRKSVRTVLRGFYGLMLSRGLLILDPTEYLRPGAIPRAYPRPTPAGALAEALHVATDRDRLMLLLGAYAGLRAAEIAAVRPAADLQDGFLYVTGKGGHQRRIPVHPILEAAITQELSRRRVGSPGTGFRYCDSCTLDGWLFPGLGGDHITPGAVSRVLSRLLPGAATAHTLRHRFASETYEVCLDLRAVQELLGHSSPNTTARYTAVTDRRLVAAVHGLQ